MARMTLLPTCAVALGMIDVLSEVSDDHPVTLRISEAPDLDDVKIYREVDIRPAKFHQIGNGHPRSPRNQR